jgi:hypothetical protein
MESLTKIIDGLNYQKLFLGMMLSQNMLRNLEKKEIQQKM